MSMHEDIIIIASDKMVPKHLPCKRILLRTSQPKCGALTPLGGSYLLAVPHYLQALVLQLIIYFTVQRCDRGRNNTFKTGKIDFQTITILKFLFNTNDIAIAYIIIQYIYFIYRW
jgi:hypothetical protein